MYVDGNDFEKKKNQQTIFSFYENDKLKENVFRIS
jgi:hypothetical protein